MRIETSREVRVPPARDLCNIDLGGDIESTVCCRQEIDLTGDEHANSGRIELEPFDAQPILGTVGHDLD